MDGTQPDRPVTQATEQKFERRRRLRNWAILIALVAVVTFFYAISMVKMAEVHQLPHFM
ncbi:MAG: hypothetical protein ACREFZ_00685 [Acetobacteraceae bacterium]